MATSPGQRGKSAESKLQGWLQTASRKIARFDWLRLPDARTAMGRGTAMPGDFEAFTPSTHFLLEIKEVNHAFRLPVKNLRQQPKMRLRALAGGVCFVIIYHTPTKKWRRIPVMDLEVKTTGSWDLSAYPEYDSVEEALPLHILGG